MPLSPTSNQGFKVIDRTEAVNVIPLQSGFVKSRNYFNMRNTTQTSITFDETERGVSLIPSTNSAGRKGAYSDGRKVKSHAFSLVQYKLKDSIKPEDIQDFRQAGEEIQGETLDNVRAEKLIDMRADADETDEYLQLEALKGISRDTDGSVIYNMFDELGATQKVIDMNLGDNTQSIDNKIHEIIRYMSKNVKTPGGFRGIDIMTDYELFDKLINHPNFRDVYKSYMNGAQPLRDDLTSYLSFGATQVVSHRGVNFWCYDHEFTLDGGSTQKTFGASEGLAIPAGARNLFRGYNGPKDTLSGVHKPGQPMFLTEYRDPRDQQHELELQMRKLYINTRPGTSVKLISST